eukprot:279646_1
MAVPNQSYINNYTNNQNVSHQNHHAFANQTFNQPQQSKTCLIPQMNQYLHQQLLNSSNTNYPMHQQQSLTPFNAVNHSSNHPLIYKSLRDCNNISPLTLTPFVNPIMS